MAEIRPVASHGAAGLIKLGTGMQPDNPAFAALRQDFMAEYELHFTDQTVLFGGINELLEKLAEQNIVWGIITNKPHVFTDRLVPKLGCSIEPAVIVSDISGQKITYRNGQPIILLSSQKKFFNYY